MAVRAPKRAVFLAAALLAAGLAGCEYADDVGPAPSARRPDGPAAWPHRFRSPSVDPELEAELDRNMAAVELVHGGRARGGGRRRRGYQRAQAAGRIHVTSVDRDAGTYTVTAACIGAPDAQAYGHLRWSDSRLGSHDAVRGTGQPARLSSGPGPLTVHLVAVGTASLQAASGVVRINEAAAFPSPSPDRFPPKSGPRVALDAVRRPLA